MKRLFHFVAFFFLLPGLSGQSSSLLESIRQDSAIDVQLMLDWRQLNRTKQKKAYQPATLLVLSPGQSRHELQAKVRTRGQRRLEICSFPPLKIKFDKAELAKHSLSDRNELDIIHHCQDGSLYEQYVLREFLAYKLWEIISPIHFKVQLLKLHYRFPDGEKAYEPSYAFFLEHTEELVSRLQARRNTTQLISRNATNKEALLKVALFQFMIGNTDWLPLNRHNLEFIGLPDHQLLHTVPYDFDYSGLVGATYAAHHESLNLASVATRYYQGPCSSEEEVLRALIVFQEKKESILQLPSSIQGLNERSVKLTTAYLEGFFEIIGHPQKLRNQIIRHCDMWPVKN